MSFVLDQIRKVDAQLDRLQLAVAETRATREPSADSPEDNDDDSLTAQQSSRESVHALLPSKRVLTLQAAIRSLSPSSTASDSRTLLKPPQIKLLLSTLSPRSDLSALAATLDGHEVDDTEQTSRNQYETELEWLLVSKATTQTYGLVLARILDEAVALADDIWYWDEILASRRYTALYSVQISPLQLWHWSSSVWEDVKARGAARGLDLRQDATESITLRWQQFYGLVRQVVSEKSMKEVHKQILSPVTRVRAEVRQKQSALKKVRIRNANALGVLLGEGLANESMHGAGLATPQHDMTTSVADASQGVPLKWKTSVCRNVALMEAVLAKINELDSPIDKFDNSVGELTDDDPLYAVETDEMLPPQAVAERLARILTLAIPQYADSTQTIVRAHGRPSWMIRYWLPITIGILSSSTALRMISNRRAQVLQNIQDLGATVVDFWQNWVVEPLRNVIHTIRHDEGSEISIMSKRSLEGDRDSLERMVVDFAADNPANATGSSSALTEAQIADIRAKVREGDLTPVLKAYEKDLASPLMGAVRGNLIRALLIQIQKTKVDVEVAMGGIDALLKSQELLIGFISLTPGLLVAYGTVHWLRSSLSQSRGAKASQKQGKMLRQLRNIDRILTRATPTDFGELYYKDQGLLLCEVHVLRLQAQRVMPPELFRELGEELEELCDVRTGVSRQKEVLERVRWAYGKWLS